jgi:hypothetical protein
MERKAFLAKAMASAKTLGHERGGHIGEQKGDQDRQNSTGLGRMGFV